MKRINALFLFLTLVLIGCFAVAVFKKDYSGIFISLIALCNNVFVWSKFTDD